ncbi:DUF397 domain-containing protein [Sphaerisporangium aureirubrum]|uniref:DUF397 domain-containing protein n=1 Tax=Sphaerisporangium aureirubrum TaxID=1544736 RepID=A0ABW1NV37_9ACTN
MVHVNNELAAAQWRKSSLSGDDGGNCVEVAALPGGRRAVRDSKCPGGPVVVFGSAQWGAFVGHLKGVGG